MIKQGGLVLVSSVVTSAMLAFSSPSFLGTGAGSPKGEVRTPVHDIRYVREAFKENLKASAGENAALQKLAAELESQLKESEGKTNEFKRLLASEKILRVSGDKQLRGKAVEADALVAGLRIYQNENADLQEELRSVKRDLAGLKALLESYKKLSEEQDQLPPAVLPETADIISLGSIVIKR